MDKRALFLRRKRCTILSVKFLQRQFDIAEMNGRSILLSVLAIVWSIGTPSQGKDVSLPLVLRDHLAGTLSESVVKGSAEDTTRMASVGTRGGIKALPITTQGVRFPLAPAGDPTSWPARLAVRIDQLSADGNLYHLGSGILVGPRQILTARHVIHWSDEIQDPGWADSLFVRPGIVDGKDLPGIKPTRIIKSWLPKSAFDPMTTDNDDWSLSELETDLGTELGWAQLGPLGLADVGRYFHILSYPHNASCVFYPRPGEVCDTVSRSDTLFHWWSHNDGKNYGWGWDINQHAWPGESGSGLLDCPDNNCLNGRAIVRGDLQSEYTFSGIDTITARVLVAVIGEVHGTTGIVSQQVTPKWGSARLERGHWIIRSEYDARMEWRNLHGELLQKSGVAREWNLAPHAHHGVTVVALFALGKPVLVLNLGVAP